LVEAERRLVLLRADAGRVDVAMADLQAHPGYRFLDSAALTGDTQRRWESAQETIAELWTQVADLHAVLDEAETIRNSRGQLRPTELARLDELLTGPAIVLASQDLPLAQRGMTGPATRVTRVSLAELLAIMTTRYQSVVDLITTAQSVLSGHATALDELTGTLTDLQRSAGALGLPESGHPLPVTLDRLTDRLDELRATVFTDPLALATAEDGRPNTARISAITAELAEVGSELDALLAFRAHAADRLNAARAELDRLTEVEATARQAVSTVRSKIVAVRLPDATSSVSRLRDLLDTVRLRCSAPNWWLAADAITDLDAAIGSAVERADQAIALADALLGRRTELRGRLDAYQAKAGRLGFAEDTALTERHQVARALLWTSPCDLAAATQALNAYQRLIAERETIG